jgi:hypothetical protein
MIRACATRLTNLNGPAQTGPLPNLSPSALPAFGEIIMPARSVRIEGSGACGSLRLSLTVVLSITSTDFREISSVLRSEPGRVRFRSKLYFTASPSSGSPSSNFRLGRSLIVRASLSSDHSYPLARLGMTCRSGVMSNSWRRTLSARAAPNMSG